MSTLSQLLTPKNGGLFCFFPIFGQIGLTGAVSASSKDDDTENKNQKDLREKGSS